MIAAAHQLLSFQRIRQPTENIVTFASPAEPHHPSLSNEPIDVNQEDSVNYWSSALGCSEFELRVAVAQVGPVVADVGNELGKRL